MPRIGARGKMASITYMTSSCLTLSDNKELIWIFRTLEISTYFEKQKQNVNRLSLIYCPVLEHAQTDRDKQTHTHNVLFTFVLSSTTLSPSAETHNTALTVFFPLWKNRELWYNKIFFFL